MLTQIECVFFGTPCSNSKCFLSSILELDALEFLGLNKVPVVYLIEQLPGGHHCRNYKFQHHLPCKTDEDKVFYSSFITDNHFTIRSCLNKLGWFPDCISQWVTIDG